MELLPFSTCFVLQVLVRKRYNPLHRGYESFEDQVCIQISYYCRYPNLIFSLPTRYLVIQPANRVLKRLGTFTLQ
jgi:hypothetical protein